MKYIILMCVLALPLGCIGFLRDDRTNQPKASSQPVSDKHFYVMYSLMDMLSEERNARLKAENEMNEMRKDLLETQRGLTQNFQATHSGNVTSKSEIEYLKNSMFTLEKNYSDLRDKYNSMRFLYQGLNESCAKMENYTELFESELASLKQIVIGAIMQDIHNVNDEVKQLENGLIAINNKIDFILSNLNARNQDFTALLKGADETGQKLNSVKEKMETLRINFTNSNLDFENKFNLVETFQNQTQSNLYEKLDVLERKQNLITEGLHNEMHKMSNRTVVTACGRSKDYSNGDIVQFPNVRVKYGISKNVLSAMGTTGKFTCEKPGLYLISVFITAEENGYFDLYINSNDRARGLFSLNKDYQTSSVLVAENLQYNNEVYVTVRAYGSSFLRLYGDIHSCISIMQIAV